MQQTVLVGQDEYKKQEDENGKAVLLRFNSTYKMWIELEFSGSESGEKAKQAISTILIEKLLDEVETMGLNHSKKAVTIPPQLECKNKRGRLLYGDRN